MTSIFQDMFEFGRTVGRTRQLFLESIRPTPRRLKLPELTRANFVKYGRERAQNGAARRQFNSTFSDIRAILTYAGSVHGVPIRHDEFVLARTALKN